MNLERLKQLIDSYGADEQRWPPDLRADMLATLDAHPQARAHLLAARELDLLLDSYQPEVVDRLPQILDALPQGAVERLLAWLVPAAPADWWRPALAGAMPLVLGIVIGLSDPGTAALYEDDSDAWEQQERALLMPPAAGAWYE